MSLTGCKYCHLGTSFVFILIPYPTHSGHVFILSLPCSSLTFLLLHAPAFADTCISPAPLSCVNPIPWSAPVSGSRQQRAVTGPSIVNLLLLSSCSHIAFRIWRDVL